MDLSKTARHPNAVVGRIEAITDHIRYLHRELKNTEDELRQMTEILIEMWDVKPLSELSTDEQNRLT